MITSEELQNKLWEGANKLRGSMDASRYKDYMLGLMFYKFLSEKTIEGFRMATRAKGSFAEVTEQYGQMFEARGEQIKKALMSTPGYYVEPQYLYSNWVKEINTGKFELQHVMDGIATFERMITGAKDADDFKDLFSTMNLSDPALGADLNMQSRNISSLILLFEDLSIIELQENDVIGDAYEYLIGQFAMESGKKAGEFYTPHQVSDVMARIAAHGKLDMVSIYDPACGSGSLLLTVKHYLSEEKRKTLHYFGQELNTATYNLARMNLLLHGVRPGLMDIHNGDTLAEDWPEDPERSDEGRLFDAVVMNPPYSLKDWNKKDLTVSDPRFEIAGVLPPANKGDYAFLLHGLYHLDSDGVMAIVLPHGVLFRGGTEGTIRQKLIDKNYIDAVIGMPANLFTNTSIPVCVVVLRKNRELDAPMLIIDASKGFVKEGKTNQLRERDIAKIVDTYLAKTEEKGYSHLASRKEIKENDYNLNIPRYVESMDTEIPHDVDAHLLGGIPKANTDDLKVLNSVVPEVMAKHLQELRPGYLKLTADMAGLRQDVLESDWLRNENEKVNGEVTSYIDKYWEEFKQLGPQAHRNLAELHDTMLQEIKDILSNHKYMDVYSGYQIIADLWSNSLNRDLKFISSEGFYEAGKLTEVMAVKGKKEPELRGKLIPNEIVAEILYADRMAEIHDIEEKVQEKEAEKAEWVEKASTEDSDEAEILGDSLKEDKSDFDVKLLTANVKEAPAGSDEKKMLSAVKKVYDEIKKLNKEIKDKETTLKKDVQERYPNLTEEEIEKLYWRKWFHNINESMVALVREPLVAELKDIELLEERYAQTVDEMDEEITAAEKELEAMQAELVVE